MSENILWYQPENLSDDDIIVVNGTTVEKGNNYNNYFQKIKKLSDAVINNKTPWAGHIKGKFFVKGNLDAIDEKGRVLGFMFFSNERNGNEALMQVLDSIGYKMTTETSDCIKKKWYSPLNMKKVIILIVLTIVIFLLSTAIWKINHN